VLEQDGVLGGAQWIITHDPTAALLFSDVEVQDSDASSGPTLVATGTSIDRGNTTNWDFPAKLTVWTNSAGTGVWSDFGNWDNGVPASGDDVGYTPVGGVCQMDVCGVVLASMDMTGYTGNLTLLCPMDVAGPVITDATLDLGGFSFTVGDNLTQHGTLNLEGAHLAVSGNLTVHGDVDGGPGGIIEVHGVTDMEPGSTLDMGEGTLEVHDEVALFDADDVNFEPSGRFELYGDTDYAVIPSEALTIVTMMIGDTYSVEFGTKMLGDGSGTVTVTESLLVNVGTLDLNIDSLKVEGATHIRLNGTLKGSYTRNYPVDFYGHLELDGDFVYKKGKVVARLLQGASLTGTLDVDYDGSELYFAAGETLTVHPSGTMRVIGGSTSNRAKLLLDGPPMSDQWHLDVRSGATMQCDNIEVGDSDASPGETCVAGGECIDKGNNDNWEFVGTDVDDAPPTHLSMRAVPNPFNPQTTVHYAVPRDGRVIIRIFDVRGALVCTLVDAPHSRGRYEEPWEGRDDARQQVGSGVYFCRIESSAGSLVQKLVLLK
jgi:hypothetical protein